MAYIDREVRRLLGKAIYEYELIDDGDRIAVAVSGGKDSMLLLWLLRERLSRIPVSYDLVAVHVDPGFDPQGADRLEAFFVREGFRYEVIRTDHGRIAHGPDNRENPCFLCSRLRRTALFRKAHELGCSKIAMGHNQDDLIETFFINIFYGAQVAGMVPRQSFFDGAVTVIRPLALVPAAKVLRLSQRLGLPIVATCCPSAPLNKRQEVRSMLEGLYRKNAKVRGNIFYAMSHVNLEYLPPAPGTRKKRENPARAGKGKNGPDHDGTSQDILSR
ncbi:ATP-binding protein [Syntrophobacter fumaroxidans]|uniref:PP-loop domain protein n=1 Tax=Syntrophobacter fumaroxidans (strain DSM 10017 / MPOB) TaxID=335543 RepID=A0LIP8_SYNFM|nr:ATP-binding protein [Syntrophobacter fumaroxidans]ABK17300.1 PP-loop domain protein [Syntrophobacter fumaroxidans MPOB]